MKKSIFFKTLLIISLLFSVFTPFAYATNTNTAENTPSLISESTQNSVTNNDTTTVSTVSSVEDNSLDLKDILNILLITVGIVIILLAIAILIKLKK